MDDPATGIHGRGRNKHCRPLRLGVDVRKALHTIVQKVGEVEVSEHNALAMHATAGASKVGVVRKKASPRNES